MVTRATDPWTPMVKIHIQKYQVIHQQAKSTSIIKPPIIHVPYRYQLISSQPFVNNPTTTQAMRHLRRNISRSSSSIQPKAMYSLMHSLRTRDAYSDCSSVEHSVRTYDSRGGSCMVTSCFVAAVGEAGAELATSSMGDSLLRKLWIAQKRGY